MQEGVLFIYRARASEFGDPDRAVASHCVGLFDVFLEVVDVRSAIVPVAIHEVDGAAGAVADEVFHVLQAHLPAAIGDGWSTEFGLAGERFHELLVGRNGSWDVHVRLAAEVGLVEGEEVTGAGSYGCGCVGCPGTSAAGVIVPQAGDIFKTRGQSRSCLTPIIRP